MINDLRSMDPAHFEQLVCQLFTKMGYQARVTGASGDGGIDVDMLAPASQGHARVIVQCKRYRGAIGEPIVRDLFGTMVHTGASKGILVTTAHVTPAARRFQQGKPIEFIDGHTLSRLLTQYGLTSSSYDSTLPINVIAPKTALSATRNKPTLGVLRALVAASLMWVALCLLGLGVAAIVAGEGQVQLGGGIFVSWGADIAAAAYISSRPALLHDRPQARAAIYLRLMALLILLPLVISTTVVDSVKWRAEYSFMLDGYARAHTPLS